MISQTFRIEGFAISRNRTGKIFPLLNNGFDIFDQEIGETHGDFLWLLHKV